MAVDYMKRQRISRIVAIGTWVVLALATRLWGCSCDPGNDERPTTIENSTGIHSQTGYSMANPPDGGVSDGGVLDGSSGEYPSGGDEGMLSSLGMEDPDSAPVEYVLLLGFDRSGKLPGRSDSMMIVAARHDTGDIGVISIPRDLWVDIPGAEPGRINKVYRVGNILNGDGGGQELIKKVIKTELGIEIDYTAAVDFSGFSKMIDYLGGIEVNVACPIQDNFISPSAKDGYVSLSLTTGNQVMNGKTALLFSRSRHGRSDMDRARRQQAVLMGLRERALSLDVVPRLPILLAAMRKHVDTDVDLAGAFRLVNLARKADLASIHGMVVKEPLVTEWLSIEGKSAVKLNRPAFDRALASIFEAPTPGSKSGPLCKAPNVALKWKELAQKRKERKRKEKLAKLKKEGLLDAGVDEEDEILKGYSDIVRSKKDHW